MDTIRLFAPSPVWAGRPTLPNRRLHQELWDELVQLAVDDPGDEHSVSSAHSDTRSPRPGPS